MTYLFDPRLKVARADCAYIDGRWTPIENPQGFLEVVYPGDERVVARIPEASPGHIDLAVAAARRAFDDGPWPRMAPGERGKYLRTITERLQQRGSALGDLWSLQMGAPASFAQVMGARPAGLFAQAAGQAESYEFERPRSREGGVGVVVREPVGVVAAILPWNAPFGLACIKLASALAAGCTVVYKPAPETPLDALVIAEACDEAGLPPGVLNVVVGGREVGDHLVRHPEIDKVSFTGSTAVGKHIAQVCGERIARYTLELGGKSPALVLEDAEPGDVLPSLIPAVVGLSGQMCAALTRLIVPRAKQDAFLEAAAAAFRGLRVGDPYDPETMVGPVAMRRQMGRVLEYIEAAKAEGAVLVAGGGRPAHLQQGFFVEPTVFLADNSARIAQDEVFGPVLTVIAYDSEDEGLRIANDTRYGLNAAVYTHDTDRAYRIARRIRAGNVTQNGWVNDNEFPFGGFKQSGVGRQGGIEGFEEYLESKAVFLPASPKLIGV